MEFDTEDQVLFFINISNFMKKLQSRSLLYDLEKYNFFQLGHFKGVWVILKDLKVFMQFKGLLGRLNYFKSSWLTLRDGN